MQREDRPGYPPEAIQMIRTAQQSQMQMSAMADQKASILMGATFVVFTLTINQAVRGQVQASMLVLGGFALVSAILAILAVLPAVTPKRGTPLNLFFFGSFTQLSEEEYIDQITARMARPDDIMQTMARDIYQNGAVLRRKKYHFLALAYRAFLVGLCATVVVFAGELLT